MKWITAQELAKLNETNGTSSDVLLLDVRTPGEYESMRLSGSVSRPLGDLNARAVAQEIGDRRCVVICQGGIRAKTAADQLEAAGAKNLEILDGGLNAWKREGFGFELGERRILPLDRQVRIVVGAMIVAGVVLGYVGFPWGFAIAGFMGCGMIFAGITDLCPLATAVAAMPWNKTSATSCSTGSCCTKREEA